MTSWKLLRISLVVAVLLSVAGVGSRLQAQEQITIQAHAMGTSTQLGRQFPVKIIINQVSSEKDQKALMDGFKSSGQNGMLKALERMQPKGRIALEGTVGNDVKYIRELPSKNGRRFRLVTDRNIAFGELYQGTRSREYDIGAAEVEITKDGKGSGTLLPACKLKLNKKKELEIESYQNPWNLTNFIVSK